MYLRTIRIRMELFNWLILFIYNANLEVETILEKMFPLRNGLSIMKNPCKQTFMLAARCANVGEDLPFID